MIPHIHDGLRRRIVTKGARAIVNETLAFRRRDRRAFKKWARVQRRWHSRYIQATYQRIGVRFSIRGFGTRPLAEKSEGA